jgi:hypothetical protein
MIQYYRSLIVCRGEVLESNQDAPAILILTKVVESLV